VRRLRVDGLAKERSEWEVVCGGSLLVVMGKGRESESGCMPAPSTDGYTTASMQRRSFRFHA